MATDAGSVTVVDVHSFDMDHADRQVVLRSSSASRLVSAACVPFLLVIWLVGVRRLSTTAWDIAFLAVCSVGAVASLVVGLLGRVVLDASGVTARCLRTRHLPWPEVAALDVSAPTRWSSRLRMPVVVKPVIVTTTGERFHLPISAGIASMGAGSRDAVEFNQIVAEHAMRSGGHHVEIRTGLWLPASS